MMINFILFIPAKCWLKARIRGTKVSTNCSPSSSSAAFSMASIRKLTKESSIWSVNRFKKSLKSFKKGESFVQFIVESALSIKYPASLQALQSNNLK